MLNDIKIGPKLIGGFAVGALLTLCMGIMANRGLKAVQAGQDQLFQEGVEGLEHLGLASTAFQRNRVSIRDMIRYNDPAKIADRDASMDKHIGEVSENMAGFKEVAATNEIRDLLKEFEGNRDGFLSSLNETRRLARENKDEEALALLEGEFKERSEKQRDLLLKMMNTTIAHAKNVDESADKKNKATTQLLWWLMIINFAVAMGLGFFLTNSIVTPLKAGVVMMNSLAAGHLQRRLRLSRRDEIGELGSVMDRFADDMQNNVVKSLAKLAAGDIAIQLTPKDDRDEISPASNKTAGSLRGLISESKSLTTAALEGRLSTRGTPICFRRVSRYCPRRQ
ncbi:MAG: MCP four helix bundle domain-containing protein [Elusimicrobia bacterium]|nr:MCP four helix bundle domain-containing protein [Elusimicrobiota bacterium]